MKKVIIWVGLFIILLVLLIKGCVVKQEQFNYVIVKHEYSEFRITARLDGTYYEKRAGDVGNPYTLYLSTTPQKGNKLSVKQISLTTLDGAVVLEITAPKMKKLGDDDSRKTYYVEILGLDLEYKDYVLRFELLEDESEKQYECIFKKEYSSEYTTIWLEAMLSI